ncbi:cytochrome C [Neisseria montereyensis]|uniref:Cytochrome C n=1 Tax=Neisseria montereyensis TaxID=2973938 RepID=A0ABT2FDP2_9NEIS|nr:cytochrome C [Neisseria montereyensis]MCS4534065.1 cytochrome C [Neisseria montereyensis]
MKMKLSTFTLIAAAAFSLAACSQQAETSVPADAVQETASADAENSVQTLTSSDGKINIVIQNGNFEDISHDPATLPDGITEEELTLLQHDAGRNISIYVANLGTPKTDAKSYFNNLKTALESTEGLSEVQTGAATDTRMNYRFVQNNDAGDMLRENCISIYETNLYNVCASSTSAPQEELAGVLKEVNLVN